MATGVRLERRDARVTVDVSIIFYVGIGLELKHMEKGKIELPWGRLFSTCATSLLPVFLLGRPGLEGPAWGLRLI
jgi:hypothetical protein